MNVIPCILILSNIDLSLPSPPTPPHLLCLLWCRLIYKSHNIKTFVYSLFQKYTMKLNYSLSWYTQSILCIALKCPCWGYGAHFQSLQMISSFSVFKTLFLGKNYFSQFGSATLYFLAIHRFPCFISPKQINRDYEIESFPRQILWAHLTIPNLIHMILCNWSLLKIRQY